MDIFTYYNYLKKPRNVQKDIHIHTGKKITHIKCCIHNQNGRNRPWNTMTMMQYAVWNTEAYMAAMVIIMLIYSNILSRKYRT